MRFAYRAYEVSATPASGGDDGYIYRPVIPFTLLGPNDRLDFFGLLDTGADESYLTRQMADRLGIQVNAESECVIESASGEMTVNYAHVRLEVTDGIETYSWKSIVGVTDQDWAEAILGHAGFLEYFDVMFRGNQREVILTRNQTSLPQVADTD